MKRFLLCVLSLALILALASDALAIGRRSRGSCDSSSGCNVSSSNGCQVRTSAPAPSVVAPPVAPAQTAPTPAPASDESTRLELKKLFDAPESVTVSHKAAASFCRVERPQSQILSVFASK